ncbi:MAG TPA: polyamine aminopropyltransferase [Symbiobacteriaceae bacterium]|nr:polyamine aminopropyltransferase [Symbiobacteriaceae bacterium]
MELYLTEQQTEHQRLSVHVTKTLHHEQTDFQELVIVETEQWGKLLALDGFFQTNDVDEFVYHEMGAHVPLFTHPNPKRVLVVGGGDGGMVREVVKHASVEHVDLVEIDGRVIETSKQYFPQIAVALTGNPKVHVHVEDGIKWVAEHPAEYDVIIIDSSEPIGPGEGLFTAEFYANVYKALTGDGVMVAQTESPWTNAHVIQRAFGGISKSFPITRLYTCAVPTYPTGLWSFTMGSKKYDPLMAENDARFEGMETKYYTPAVHLGALQLPRFVAKIVQEAAK